MVASQLSKNSLDHNRLDGAFATAKDKLSDSVEKAQDFVKKGRETIVHGSGQVLDEAKSIGKKIGSQVKDRPYLYAMGAVGLVGAGFLLAKFIAKGASAVSPSEKVSEESSPKKGKGWSKDESGLKRDSSASAKGWSTDNDTTVSAADGTASASPEEDGRAAFH